MSYIGNQPYQAAFVTDTFSGNGSTTAFTMSVAPAGTTSVLVAVTGVLQDPSTYSVTGTTLTFSAAPPSGTGNISVRYLGIPASGVTTTAYRTVTEFTATAGQTTFTPPSYTVGYINVYRNGVLLGSADYTATNGTTVVLARAATAGDLVTTESFYVSSVLNAISTSGGTIAGNLTINSASGQAPLVVQANGSYGLAVDSSGSVGIGFSSPTGKLDVAGSSSRVRWNLSNAYAYQVVTNPADSAYATNRVDAASHDWYVSNAQKMTLDTSGNLLVGVTTNQNYSGGTTEITLGVTGTGATSGGALTFASGSGLLGYVAGQETDVSLGTYTSTPLKFTTANTERARIDSSGNLLVGTTSGTRKLQVKGAIGFEQISGGTNVWETYHYTDNTYRCNYNGAGGDEFILYTNGNYAFSGSNVSDERLKQDITPEVPQLANVLMLAPKTYRFKPRETQNGIGEVSGIKHGFIAQEVLQLMPELVSGDPSNSHEVLGVDYNGIVALCVKAIQELNAKVEAQAAEIAQLKGQA